MPRPGPFLRVCTALAPDLAAGARAHCTAGPGGPGPPALTPSSPASVQRLWAARAHGGFCVGASLCPGTALGEGGPTPTAAEQHPPHCRSPPRLATPAAWGHCAAALRRRNQEAPSSGPPPAVSPSCWGSRRHEGGLPVTLTPADAGGPQRVTAGFRPHRDWRWDSGRECSS